MALVVRLVYYYLYSDLTDWAFSIKGVPFSDAIGWSKMARKISEGESLPYPWTAYRPFYSIFLASFYTWLGPSFTLAKLLKIVCSALTVSFVYLIGERVFNRVIGLISALVLAFSMPYLYYTLLLLTETVGLFFFVLSVYLIFVSLENKRMAYFFVAGVFFSLSNLTRTLTIVAFPGYIVCIFYLLTKQRAGLRKTTCLVAIFIFGVLISLAPWLIRQKIVHGIFSISTNSASGFYAATSPQLGKWKYKLLLEPGKKGVRGIKNKYDYFMKGAFENIKKNPTFYLRNISRNFFWYLNALQLKNQLFRSFSILFILFLFLYNLFHLRGTREILLLVALLAGILAIDWIFFRHIMFLAIISGMILSFAAIENRYSLILINSLVFAGVGGAIFGMGKSHRLFLMAEWIFQLYYLFAILFIFQFLYHKAILRSGDSMSLQQIARFDSFAEDRALDSDLKIKRVIRVILLAILLFFLFSALRLIYLNYFEAHPRKTVISAPTSHQKWEIMAKIHSNSPNLINLDKMSAMEELVFEKGKITQYVYRIPRMEGTDKRRVFFPRNYDRTILLLSKSKFVVFPDELPEHLINSEVVIVGRSNIDTKSIKWGSRSFIEGIAIIPWNSKANRLQVEDMLLAKNENHRRILERLKSVDKSK
jgi:4-amino-4-deoxy-L-arabinose transferase-like glycosyltransferase